MRNALFAFVDLKDPFTSGQLAGESLPGPVLSLLAARPFTDVFLFHTPHTQENAEATVREIGQRHPGTYARLYPLPVSDPKDYSGVMGALTRQVSRLAADLPEAERSICVSSGTAEMRAAWFLLRAANILPARLLQVRSPAEPLPGAPEVKEISLGGGEWTDISDLLMPVSYVMARPPRPAPPGARRPAVRSAEPLLSEEPPQYQRTRPPEPHPELDAALRELNFHVLSPKMRLVVERAEVVASCDEAALILGETGTGKELIARLVHRLSPRRQKKMVVVNCGAIPHELAESHLFGHVKGAFTGAVTDREGLFHAAHGSTLFLDEIGELTPACQAKILRAVQFGSFERVGSSATLKVDVRLIAATHRNLREEITKGSFREDLYHRLNVLALEAPPLRDRPGEIVPLALAILKDINARRQQPRQISKEGLRRLEQHHWPGNVRELESVLKRSVVFGVRPVLEPEDILIDNAAPAADPLVSLPSPAPGFSLEEFLEKARAHLILRALEKAGGNQTAAAALLGISKQAVSKFLAGNQS